LASAGIGTTRRAGIFPSGSASPGGGYRLSRPVGETSVADIIAAVNEPIKATRCKDGSTKGCLRQEGRCIAHDLSDRARRVVEDKFSEARAWTEGDSAAAARERVDEAMGQLREGYVQVQGEVEGVVDDLTDYVRHNPGQSVLIAAGLGFVIGLLFRRGE
jgi:ElaB/YqjD/DUF883 family membrane-anchored ribosome-binding protein